MKYTQFEKRMKCKKGNLPEALKRLSFGKNKEGFKIAYDPLTKKGDDIMIVTPVAMHDGSDYVVCPFCGSIHSHGVSDGTYAGGRVADCHAGAYEITPILA